MGLTIWHDARFFNIYCCVARGGRKKRIITSQMSRVENYHLQMLREENYQFDIITLLPITLPLSCTSTWNLLIPYCMHTVDRFVNTVPVGNVGSFWSEWIPFFHEQHVVMWWWFSRWWKREINCFVCSFVMMILSLIALVAGITIARFTGTTIAVQW